MNKKDELIIGILKEDLKGIRKLLKDQEKQIKDIDKNGFDSEVHPGWHLDMRTGLSYTQGYCIGYIKMAEEVIGLLEMNDAKDVEVLIAENKKIHTANKKHLDEVFNTIRKRVKTSEDKEGKEKKTLNDVFGIFKGKKKKESLKSVFEKRGNKNKKK